MFDPTIQRTIHQKNTGRQKNTNPKTKTTTTKNRKQLPTTIIIPRSITRQNPGNRHIPTTPRGDDPRRRNQWRLPITWIIQTNLGGDIRRLRSRGDYLGGRVPVYRIKPKCLKKSLGVMVLVTGQRAWDPPEPIPNSEVKPRSVCDISVVFGYAKSRKLVATFYPLNASR